MLELAGIGKRFGQVTVLDDVSLTAETGEILAVCGENGAGKTTLMNIVAGVIPWGGYQGAAVLDGEELRFQRPGDAETAGVVLLPQELLYYPDLSVAENVLAGGLPSRHGLVRRGEMNARAHELCAQIDLHVPLDTPLRAIETSDRQLVSIARALSYDARVLILDEPTASLPRRAAERLFSVVRKLASEQRTVIYISHHLGEIVSLADRVCVLRNGRLVMPATNELSVPRIITAMLGRDVVTTAPTPVAAAEREPFFSATVEFDGSDEAEATSVRLDVARGEIVGLAGLPGSGRDRVVQFLGGEQRRGVRGALELAGKPIRRSTLARRESESLLYVPSDRRADGILPLGTVADNVLLGREMFASWLGIRRPRSERRAVLELLEAYAVTPPRPSQTMVSLSGGNQQKAILARAGLREPQVLVLSEPTRGVDIGARQTIYQLIQSAASAGTCVIVASDDPAELVHLCHRVLTFWRGAPSRSLAGPELIEEAVLAAVNGEDRRPPTGGDRATESSTAG